MTNFNHFLTGFHAKLTRMFHTGLEEMLFINCVYPVCTVVFQKFLFMSFGAAWTSMLRESNWELLHLVKRSNQSSMAWHAWHRQPQHYANATGPHRLVQTRLESQSCPMTKSGLFAFLILQIAVSVHKPPVPLRTSRY